MLDIRDLSVTLKVPGGELHCRDYLGLRLAMIFQEPMTSLNPVYTIGRQLTEATVRNGTMGHLAARRRAIDLLDRVGIADPETRMSQYPHQLSGGQRQRAMIAMALMQDPELLICDEPTTALDVTVQAQIMELLSDLRREFEMAMILITHDLAVVANNVDRVVVMYGGEVVEGGMARHVLHDPLHPYTRALLGAIPKNDGPRQKLRSIPGTVPSMLTLPAGCIFAPRCDVALPGCSDSRPPIKGDDDHWRRCVLSDAAAASAKPEALEVDRHAGRDQPGVALEARGVTRVFRSRKGTFGKTREIRAVDDLSLTIRSGETLALVGEKRVGQIDAGTDASRPRHADGRGNPARRNACRDDGSDPPGRSGPADLPGSVLLSIHAGRSPKSSPVPWRSSAREVAANGWPERRR